MKKVCIEYSAEFQKKLDKKGYTYKIKKVDSGNKKIIIPNYNRPILEDLDLFRTRNKVTSYRGSPFYSLVTLLYIKNKFPDSCVIIPFDNDNIDAMKHEDLSIRYNEKKRKVMIPKKFWNCFYKCNNKRYVVFPFGYSCTDGSGHANILIYDNVNRTLERFEPYGNLDELLTSSNKSCFKPNIDDILFKMFTNKDLIDEYFPPSTFIPNTGLQKIQEDENNMSSKDPGGFCTMWSLFYCDLRLSNPDVDRELLLEYTMKVFKKSNKSLTQFIRDYSNIVTELTPCLISRFNTSLKK